MCLHRPCVWPRCRCNIDIVWTKAYMNTSIPKFGKR